MVSKTRMSAVIDHSSMGLNLGTDFLVGKATYTKARKAMYKACIHGCDFNVVFKLIEGDPLKGRALYRLQFPNYDGTPNSVLYEFKELGNNYYISVSGNPTRLLSGRNDIPVLVINSAFELKSDYKLKQGEKKYNRATVTFKYLNRIMYAILDWLLEPFDFAWEGSDKINLINGEFNITTYQIAWYSGDLKDARSTLLNYLRVIYGSLDATEHSVKPGAAAIGLNTRVWENSSGNLSIEARTGEKRAFSLTWYAKDLHPDSKNSEEDRRDRVRSLIRWDCTLNHIFLANNKMKTIKAIEERFIDECETVGKYDTGFVRYISNVVTERIKFNYLIRLNRETYKQALSKLEELEGKYERLIAKHWINFGQPLTSYPEAMKYFNAKFESTGSNTRLTDKNRARYMDAKEAIKRIGIDVDIPKTYHDTVLFGRAMSMITREERTNINIGSFNKTPRFDELQERDAIMSAKLIEALNDDEGITTIRKFAPDKVKPGKFWILTNSIDMKVD